MNNEYYTNDNFLENTKGETKLIMHDIGTVLIYKIHNVFFNRSKFCRKLIGYVIIELP